MNLAELIKCGIGALATATPATIATINTKNAQTVANVATVAVAETQKVHSYKWSLFVDECLIHGVTEVELAAMFREQDKADMCDEPEHKLPLHGRTIADAIKVKRTTVVIDLVERRYVVNPVHVQRCTDCKHFNRTHHPHLGNCAAGEPEGIAGNWDTDTRAYCKRFEVTP